MITKGSKVKGRLAARQAAHVMTTRESGVKVRGINLNLLGQMILKVKDDPLYKNRDFDTLVVHPMQESNELRAMADHFELEIATDNTLRNDRVYFVNGKRFLDD